MYVAILVIPVPDARRDDYRVWAENSARFFADYGCREVIDLWEDNVPAGQRTDFRRAVAAEPDEKIAVSWQVWPSKAALDEAERRMHEDPRMDAGEPPFDAKRLILGRFGRLEGSDGS